MRKTFGIVVFIVLMVLTSAVPASAQAIRWGYIPRSPEGWYYMVRGDQVGMLTADNVAMVRRLTNQLPRSLGPDLRWNGRTYGLNTQRGFYEMYDHDRQPMSQGKAIGVGAGVGAGIGAGIGYSIARNSHGHMSDARSTLLGAGIGATGGAIMGLLTHRGDDKDDVVVTPTGSRPPTYWSHSAPVSVTEGGLGVRNNPNDPTQTHQAMNRMATNRTGMEVGVFHKGDDPRKSRPVEVISRNGKWSVPLSDEGYDVYVLVPTNTLGVQDVKKAVVVPNRDMDGWDIVVPAVQ